MHRSLVSEIFAQIYHTKKLQDTINLGSTSLPLNNRDNDGIPDLYDLSNNLIKSIS